MGSKAQNATVANASQGFTGCEALEKEVAAAEKEGRTDRLGRWLDRELDEAGAPQRLDAREWPLCLSLLAEARRKLGPSWSTEIDARVEGFFLHLLRFMRPDGSMVFGPEGVADSTRQALRYWADQLSDPGFQTVLNWWFPGPRREHSPPPLPASNRPDRPLATLRADWLKSGDLMAVDHRSPGPVTNFEFMGLGRSWLGPTWSSGTGASSTSRPRMSQSLSNATVDHLEWSFRAGESKVVRTALLFRGRRLALLADQVESKDKSPLSEMRVATREGVQVTPSQENRSISLSLNPRQAAPRIIPLALSERSSDGEPGTFRHEGQELILSQPTEGKRRWLPLLISWESGRNRKPVHWYSLTVADGPQICAPETAVAYRVAWGRDESLVIYRSLVRPVPRSFLGHKTNARFLIGLFTKEGNVEPILTVKE